MMSATEYMALLKKTGLLSPAQWTVAEEASRRHSSPAELSTELVRLGLLTTWQSMQLLKGQTGFVLHHYRLLEAVGRGGMGHVFKAQDSRSSGIVAIKVMSRKLSSNQNLVSRFRREIRASSRLSSPNIVRTLDAGRVGKIDFMVMEFVNGDQLDSILTRLPLIPPSTACEVIRQAALGLQHAFECRMVHRDIKPGNLMVDWDTEGRGIIKIMDMGLVRLDEEKENATAVTRAGQVMGTPDYMSPEQGLNTSNVDIRSDIYSLGCTFYRMLTGRMPFPGDNPLQVLMARCREDAPSPKLIRPDIPDAIDAIVRKMTRLNAAERYQTPAEAVAALEPHCGPLTIAALRQCAREQGADEEAIVLDAASRVDLSDPQDAGYQQFLREMDTGASVDLMMSNTPSGGFALAPTFPVLQDRRTHSPDRRPGDVANRTGHRNRRTGLLILSVVAVVVAIVGTIVLFRSPSKPAASDSQNKTAQAQPVAEKSAPPSAKLIDSAPLDYSGGDQLDYQPEFDGSPPAPSDGQLVWKLVAGHPSGVSINARTGNISWKIPDGIQEAAYPIPFILLHKLDGSETVIAKSEITVVIKSALPKFQLTPPKTISIRPGQSVAQRIESVPPPPRQGSIRFRLAGKVLDGMSIDGGGGEFRWTPQNDQLGKHQLTVELHDQQSKTTLASTTLDVVVVPQNFQLVLPGVPSQTASPGQTLRIPLFGKTPPKEYGQLYTLQLENRGLPPNVGLEDGSSTLVWDVPADARGSFSITLNPRILIPDLPLPTDAKPVVINITVGTPKPSTTKPLSNIPDPELVQKAETELRERHRRELASTTRRTSLLKQLLETALDQPPGPGDLALLNVIITSEGGTKAADSILDATLLRKKRYNVEIPQEIVELCKQLKPASLNPAQGDRISEFCLALAANALASEQWGALQEFLKVPVEYSKKGGRNSLPEEFTTDLTKALEAASLLQQQSSATPDILKRDIEATLSTWQFQPALRGPNGIRAITAVPANLPAPPTETAPWTYVDDRVSLKGQPSPISYGILDPALDSNGWILRTQVAASATSCRFAVGTDENGKLKGYMISLEPPQIGLTIQLPSGNVVAPPNPNASWPTSGSSHDLEIRVYGREFRVRIDGIVVATGNFPQSAKGAAGFLASMEKAAPDKPVLELRRTRFLRLP
jgi:serine/threonine-protein kinase